LVAGAGVEPTTAGL